MKCIKCENSKSNCYYSPKQLTKYEIYFCSKCLKSLINQDLRYIEKTNKEYAQNEVKKLIKR